MRVGDLSEWLGAACFAAAAYLWGGFELALVVAGVALAYFGQCYANHPVPKLPKVKVPWRKGADE
jgi:hypothetical protein